jgi:hypothetical protein
MPADALTGRQWLAALPDELAAQRRVLAGLLDHCAAWPLVTSLQVGCSLGRGAADALSDIDAALGVDTRSDGTAHDHVEAAEALVLAVLPELGPLVDVLRRSAGSAGQVRVVFAQYADGTQLDLAVVPDAEIRARHAAGGAPDFIPLYQVPPRDGGGDEPSGDGGQRAEDTGASGWPAADAVTGEQVREWAFRGWLALLDADKYLRRGSLWEAHARLHEARDCIWALWAAGHGALYPWHGLSQVLDHDPRNLPPGIEATVAGLDAADLRRAARASAEVLATASAAAARRQPAPLPAAMAAYVSRVLSQDPST